MAKFQMKVIDENKTLKIKTIRLTPGKGATIQFGDIKKFYKKLVNNQNMEMEQIVIKGMCPDKMRTLGTANGHTTIKKMMDDIKDFDDDEYYADKAVNPQKFNNFDFVDFIIFE